VRSQQTNAAKAEVNMIIAHMIIFIFHYAYNTCAYLHFAPRATISCTYALQRLKQKKKKGKRMRINGSIARAVLPCVGYYASSTNPFILDYRKTRYARCGSN